MAPTHPGPRGGASAALPEPGWGPGPLLVAASLSSLGCSRLGPTLDAECEMGWAFVLGAGVCSLNVAKGEPLRGRAVRSGRGGCTGVSQ